MISCFRLLD